MLTVRDTGIFAIQRGEELASIPFDENFGDSLYDSSQHHLGITINSMGDLTATIDAVSAVNTVNIGLFPDWNLKYITFLWWDPSPTYLTEFLWYYVVLSPAICLSIWSSIYIMYVCKIGHNLGLSNCSVWLSLCLSNPSIILFLTLIELSSSFEICRL